MYVLHMDLGLKNLFVTYNQEFVIGEFITIEFDCTSLKNSKFANYF